MTLSREEQIAWCGGIAAVQGIIEQLTEKIEEFRKNITDQDLVDKLKESFHD